MSVAPGQNVAAKRKLNASLAESAIGYVGKLLREEAAKLGITTVSIPPQSASQTCPRCGDRHPNNRESQAETPFLNPNPPKGSGHPEEARDERSRLETAWP